MKKILAILLLAPLLSACGPREAMPYDQLAQCLTDKGVKMYGSDECPHCLNQKKTFKGSFDLVNYVECRQNPTACEAAGIQAYPTWEIDGKKYEGEKSLSALGELAGCPVTESK